MQIKEMRISVVQVEFLGDLLRTRQTPAIPFSFLLSGPLFQSRLRETLGNKGQLGSPDDGYASHFWNYYAKQSWQDVKQSWRALVPLEYKLAASVQPSWPGQVELRAYLYPWGIGVLADASLTGLWDFDEAVNKALEVRASAKSSVHLDNQATDKSLNALIGAVLDHVRKTAYGAVTPQGGRSDPFTVVTVLEGDGAAVNVAITSGGDDHKRLEALTGWNNQYKNLDLRPLAKDTLEIKGQAPLAHVLYAKRRARAVWFPGYFKSLTHDDRLLIYHRNLTMASLQTESLCQLAQDTANLLDNKSPVSGWSVSYSNCAQFAAGLLGRLYGGTTDIYRSKSVQYQIQSMYAKFVNTLRSYFKMASLAQPDQSAAEHSDTKPKDQEAV